METTVNESKSPAFKRLGFLGIGLCALCCALPILGTILGVGALSSLAVYFEKAGMLVLIASGGLFALWYFNKRKAPPSCDIDCSCKETNQLSEGNSVEKLEAPLN